MGSTHTPPQSTSAPGQETAHAPSLQTLPAVHTAPAEPESAPQPAVAPQWFGSLFGSTQLAPQLT